MSWLGKVRWGRDHGRGGAGILVTYVDEIGDEADEDDGDGLVHIACCDDENVALCGADVSGHEWNVDGTPTTCPICVDLDDLDLVNNECPGCPLWMRCESGQP